MHAVNRELERDVFLVEPREGLCERFDMAGVFLACRAAGGEGCDDGALLFFKGRARLGEVAADAADRGAVVRDVAVLCRLEFACRLVKGAQSLVAAMLTVFRFFEQGRTCVAQLLFLLGTIQGIGEGFVEVEPVFGRFALDALLFAGETFLLPAGLRETFFEAAAIRLDAIDAGEDPIAFFGEDVVVLARFLRLARLDVLVVEALADGVNAAVLFVDGCDDVLQVFCDLHRFLCGRIELVMDRLLFAMQGFLRLEVFFVLALQVLVDVERREAVSECILCGFVFIAELLIISDALLALFDGRFALVDAFLQEGSLRFCFFAARCDFLIFGKRMVFIEGKQ